MKSIIEIIGILRAVEPVGRIPYYLVLFLMAVITACLDMVSVALVFGVVTAIVKPDMIDTMPFFGKIAALFGQRPGGLPVALQIGLVFVGLVVAKNLMKIYFSYVQARLVNDWMRQMTCRVFSTYINAPYLFHKQTNSSELIRNSAGVINTSYGGAVTASIAIAVNCLVIAMITLVLFYLQPIPALIAGALAALVVVGQNFFFSGRLQRLGAEHYALAEKNLRNLLQGYGAIKEIKILGREAQLRQTFGSVQSRWARLRHINQFVNALPAQVAELALVLTVVALIAVSIWFDNDLNNIIPIAALFAAAASRILPAANHVLSALNQINTNLPGLRILHREIKHPWGELPAAAGQVKQALPFQDEIRFDGVTFEYPAGDVPALRGVDLIIPKGEYLGIVGGSGAGKSTLIDLLLGLLTPKAGRISVDGRVIAESREAWQLNLGYVPQEIYITDDTVRANVAFGMAPQEVDDAKVWQALTLAQLDGFVRSLPTGLDTILGEHGDRLSGGQRQRVGIARALYREPVVLVFDEPTSDLDVEIEREISNTLSSLKRSRTIIVVAHRLAMLNNCDRILIMRSGRIMRQCSYAELLKSGLRAEDDPSHAELPTTEPGLKAG